MLLEDAEAASHASISSDRWGLGRPSSCPASEGHFPYLAADVEDKRSPLKPGERPRSSPCTDPLLAAPLSNLDGNINPGVGKNV